MHSTIRVDIIGEDVSTHIGQYYDEPNRCEKWYAAMNFTRDTIGHNAALPGYSSSFNDVFDIDHNKAFDTPEEAEEYIRKQIKSRCVEILAALDKT